jgi:hypothetical protein
VGESTERWRSVPGYEGWYEVSDLGNVASLARQTTRGKVLRPQPSTKGYWTVGLSKYGKVKQHRISNLVLEAFVGPRPPGNQACHGPAGRADDSLANLSWGTPSENQLDRRRDGTSNQGERSVRARLTEAIVLECRRRYTAGETQTALAAEFGVSHESMGAAIRGRTWAHVTGGILAPDADGGNLGERGPNHTLTEAIVLECRRRYAAGETQAALAIEFGVTSGAISSAIHGRTWAHLTEGIPDPEIDGRSLISTPQMRERRREYGRRGAEKRWRKA